MTRQRFTNHADSARINCVAWRAVRRAADGILQPAAFAELTHQLAARRIHIFFVASADVLGSPRVQFSGEHAVALVEERAVQVAVVGQLQSPLNTGFCLATNAS